MHLARCSSKWDCGHLDSIPSSLTAEQWPRRLLKNSECNLCVRIDKWIYCLPIEATSLCGARTIAINIYVFDLLRTSISRRIFKLQNNYETQWTWACRGAGHWSEATQAISHFLINLRFQLCVCCAAKCLTVAASSCCVRNLESIVLRTREPLASESIFILCASSRGIYIVALACFVHLAFQVQVYYRRRCNEMAARANECAPGVGSTNERPVSSRQINLL